MKWLFIKIKEFLFFLVKESFKFVYRTILTVVLIFIVIVIFAKNKENRRLANLNTNYRYVEIDLGRNFTEGELDPINEILHGDFNYFTLQEAIKNIGQDEKVQGIIFKIDNFALDSAQSEEIGKLIQKVKGDKKIYMYATGISRKSYDFALNGEIIMPPTSAAQGSITGYSTVRPFYKRLGEKLGVSFTVVHIGDYKSFGEDLTSTSMSDFSRENIVTLLDGLHDRFILRASKLRGLEKEYLNKNILDGELALVTPKELKERKLIDKLEYYYDLKERLSKSSIITLDEYFQIYRSGEDFVANKELEKDTKYIGIITLDGEISHFENAQELNVITYERAYNRLKEAMEDSDVKGIVVRINSPGGSALTSELIHQMVLEMKKKYGKPLYISMGSVAASGGYYIAASGDKIYANETTLTGSIGVVSILPNIGKLADKLGVDIEEITNGKNTNLYSITEKPTEERLEILRQSSENVYNEFKERVSKGRGMTLDEVEKVAQGRVWTGTDGVKNRLVDGIATLDETVNILAEDLKIENGKFRVKEIYVGDMRARLKQYFKIFGRNIATKEIIRQYLQKGLLKNLDEFNVEVNKPILYTDFEIL